MEQKSQVLLVITKTTKGPFGNFFKNNISISTYLEHTWYVQISWAASAATVLFMKQSEKKIRSKVMTPFSDCLSLPFVMPEIYHEQFEQKMGTPTRHYHHYLDESIIKSGRPMSSALISQPFSLTLPCCTGGTSFMKSNWDDNVGRVHSCKHLQCGYKWELYKKCNYINYILPTAIITRGLYFFIPFFTAANIVERLILRSG